MTPRFEQTGSILNDSISSRLIDVETSLDIQSNEPREAIAKLVDTAERMCFLMDAIRRPHELRSITRLNGEPIHG